jgi:hypothetical protein
VNIETFEREVMKALLAGDDPLLESLRAQYAAADVKAREISGPALFVKFDVPADAPRIDRRLLHLDDLQLQLKGADTPAEASLTVRNGRLERLECSVYDGGFPSEPVIEEAWYYGTARFPGITAELLAERDVEELLEDE